MHRRAYRLSLHMAWHAEAFARQDRLPDLAEVLARASGAPDDEDAPELQMARARAIAERFSGLPE